MKSEQIKVDEFVSVDDTGTLKRMVTAAVGAAERGDRAGQGRGAVLEMIASVTRMAMVARRNDEFLDTARSAWSCFKLLPFAAYLGSELKMGMEESSMALFLDSYFVGGGDPSEAIMMLTRLFDRAAETKSEAELAKVGFNLNHTGLNPVAEGEKVN